MSTRAKKSHEIKKCVASRLIRISASLPKIFKVPITTLGVDRVSCCIIKYSVRCGLHPLPLLSSVDHCDDPDEQLLAWLTYRFKPQ